LVVIFLAMFVTGFASFCLPSKWVGSSWAVSVPGRVGVLCVGVSGLARAVPAGRDSGHGAALAGRL
jgi:hypothetical protein